MGTAGSAGSAEPAPGSEQPPPEKRAEEAAPEATAPAPATVDATELLAPEPGAKGAAPAGRPAKTGGTQAEIAAQRAAEGKQAVMNQQFAVASQKFRDAVARVPEPAYFLDLCVSLFLEGKLGESLTACNAVEPNGPTPELKQKAEKMIVRIRDEARRQGLQVAP